MTHAHRHSAGTGPVCRGRFKLFPVQEGGHCYTVCRYVERNPRRSNLVRRPEAWRWSGLWHQGRATGVAVAVRRASAGTGGWAE